MSIDDWLITFVGIDRAVMVVRDITYNKNKAKRISKWMIICICLITVTSYLHDPIYRRMVDDTEDGRTWCYVQFNSSFQLLNSIIIGFHYIFPFILNISSALIIIINTARQRFAAQKEQSYKHQLRKQLYTLKHLLISPVILIILALSRLIISFLTGCMKTTRGHSWLYLIGYLISFLPPSLTFIVFVVSSKTYNNELNETVKRIKRYINRA